MVVYTDGDITIKAKDFQGSECLSELFTRKKVCTKHVNSYDRWTDKNILLMTNAHLHAYQTRGAINVTGGETIRDIMAPIFGKL